MTGQEIDTLMQRKRYITVLAFWYPSAHLAFYHRSKSSSVLEEDGLLSILQCLSYCRQKLRRISSCHHLAMAQVFHIHHLYLWQLDVLISCFQFYQSVFPLLRIIIALHGRGSCSQQNLGVSIHISQHDGCTAGMIAWSWILLLEGCLVLFIYDDKSQPLERQEDGTSRSQYHVIRLVRQLLLPDFHTFSITVFRVIDTQTVTEDLVQPLHNLYG